MAFRSEAEEWREERDRVASKLTIAERVTRWFERPAPERDVYAWVILDEVFEERS